jgi:hypothetical protein
MIKEKLPPYQRSLPYNMQAAVVIHFGQLGLRVMNNSIDRRKSTEMLPIHVPVRVDYAVPYMSHHLTRIHNPDAVFVSEIMRVILWVPETGRLLTIYIAASQRIQPRNVCCVLFTIHIFDYNQTISLPAMSVPCKCTTQRFA